MDGREIDWFLVVIQPAQGDMWFESLSMGFCSQFPGEKCRFLQTGRGYSKPEDLSFTVIKITRLPWINHKSRNILQISIQGGTYQGYSIACDQTVISQSQMKVAFRR